MKYFCGLHMYHKYYLNVSDEYYFQLFLLILHFGEVPKIICCWYRKYNIIMLFETQRLKLEIHEIWSIYIPIYAIEKIAQISRYIYIYIFQR